MSEHDHNHAPHANEGHAPLMNAKLFFIKDLSVENPAAPAIFVQELGDPKLNFDFSVGVTSLNDNDIYEVEIKITANAFAAKTDGQEEICLYMVELAYCGVFGLAAEIAADANLREEMLYGQCAAALYPHAARVVMEAIRDAGYAPPMLSTAIDLVQAYKLKQAEKKK
jgi:preprotein translocase subunit SecB